MPQIINIDGVGQVEFPDGMSDDDIRSAIKRNVFRQTGREANTATQNPLPRQDPLAGMSKLDIAAAASGKAFRDLYRGGKQLLNIGDQKTLQNEIDRAKASEAPLLKHPLGFASNLATNALIAAPTMLIPGANTVLGATMVGGMMGALQPTASDESAALSAALGAAGGGIGQAAANTVGTAIRGLRPSYSAEGQRLVGELAKQVPLDAAQRTGNRTLSLVDAAMENLPVTSGLVQARRQAQQTAFNRAVSGTFGSADDALTKPAMTAARERIGGNIGNIASRNAMDVTAQVLNDVGAVETLARQKYASSQAGIVSSYVDDFLSKVQAGKMDGEAYRILDSKLGQRMRSTTDGDLRNVLGDLRAALRNAMDASISPADAKAWAQARAQYANLMRVAGSGIDDAGNVSAAKLSNTTRAKNNRFQTNDLDQLARAGGVALRKPVGDSGTAQRVFYQGALTGGGGLAGLVGGNGDMESAAYGAAGGALAPLAIYAAMNNPASRAVLARGLLGQSPATNALATGLSPLISGAGIGLGLLSNPNQ